jgi:hypothetical protein
MLIYDRILNTPIDFGEYDAASIEAGRADTWGANLNDSSIPSRNSALAGEGYNLIDFYQE